MNDNGHQSTKRSADTRFPRGRAAAANDASVYSFDLSSRKCVGISGRGSVRSGVGVDSCQVFLMIGISTSIVVRRRAGSRRQAKEGPPGPLLTGWRLESFLRALQISVAECVLYV